MTKTEWQTSLSELVEEVNEPKGMKERVPDLTTAYDFSASNVAEASSSRSGKASSYGGRLETPMTVVANPGRDRERFPRKLEPPAYNGEEPGALIFRAE
ncbi:unnamed protein product [Dovyalis caffra]|uniref:Uncharacterized protein n=1 Tax=Dovyalis caffra TaxID=77055 RepID=A0AAV1R3S3_9ROSI|nr:unnamed protein product [Dovyalis caffra]